MYDGEGERIAPASPVQQSSSPSIHREKPRSTENTIERSTKSEQHKPSELNIDIAWLTTAIESLPRLPKKYHKTYDETLSLFKKGHSLKEIAKIRHLKPNTIAKHAIKLLLNGHDISIGSIDQYVEPGKQQRIIDFQKIHGLDDNESVKQYLKYEFFYNEFNIMAAWLLSEHRELISKASASKGRQRNPRQSQKSADSNDESWSKALRRVDSTTENVDVDEVLRNCNSGSSIDKRWAAITLGELGDIRGADPLIRMLDHNDANVRIEALDALRKLKVQSSYDHIAEKLNDSHGKVRANALIALNRVDQRRGFDALLKSLVDPFEIVRETGIILLGEKTDKRAVQPLISLIHHDNDRNKMVGLITLGKIGDSEAFDTLRQYLNNENPELCECAAEALGYLNDERALDLLRSAKNDQLAKIRAGAIRGLGLQKDIESIDAIISELTSEYASVRLSAAEALGNIGGAKQLFPLIETLNDENVHVRRAATISLGQLGFSLALDPLNKMLEDDDEYVREEAQISISVIKANCQEDGYYRN